MPERTDEQWTFHIQQIPLLKVIAFHGYSAVMPMDSSEIIQLSPVVVKMGICPIATELLSLLVVLGL